MDSFIDLSSSSSPEPLSRSSVNVRIPHDLSRPVPQRRDDAFIEFVDSDEEECIVWPLKKLKETVHDGDVSVPTPSRHSITSGSRPGPSNAPSRPAIQDTSPTSSSPRRRKDATRIDPLPTNGGDDVNNHFQYQPEPLPDHPDSPIHIWDASDGVLAESPSSQLADLPLQSFASSMSPVDPTLIDTYVAQVLEAIPDAQIDLIIALILQHLQTSKDKVVEDIVSILCDNTMYAKFEVNDQQKAPDDSDIEELRQLLLELYCQPSEAAETDVGAPSEPPAYLENAENGDGIECGCCFTTCTVHKMIQCPDAHVFCGSCITSYASGLLGSHNADIVCLDQSGCKLPFPDSELRRMLSRKLMELYDRVKQMKEIEAAGLENLEACPFCDYMVVIENEDEKLLWCANEECAAVSCRGCKKLDHIPKSCEEAEEAERMDGRHRIEEAMTRALMRNCPKCQKAFIKEAGCNKINCPHCGTTSCYICREIITGYDHFDRPDLPLASEENCTLWDPVEERYDEEITIAAERALAEYQWEHPDLNEEDVNMDLLLAGPGAGPAPDLHDIPLPPPVPAPLPPPRKQLPIPPALPLPRGNPAFVQPFGAMPDEAFNNPPLLFIDHPRFDQQTVIPIKRALPVSPSGSTVPPIPPFFSRLLPAIPFPIPPPPPPLPLPHAQRGHPEPQSGILDAPVLQPSLFPQPSSESEPDMEPDHQNILTEERPPPSPQYGILDLPKRALLIPPQPRPLPQPQTGSGPALESHHLIQAKWEQGPSSPEDGILDLSSPHIPAPSWSPPLSQPESEPLDFPGD